MVVAARAGQRQAEKRLGVVLGQIDRIAVDEEVVDGAVLGAATLRSRQIAHERVPRAVGGDRGADPAVERAHVVGPQPSGRDEQEIGPLPGPVVDELGALEQLRHEPIALVGGAVGEERLDLGRVWQDAGGIEIRATNELFVEALARWREVQLAQLLQDEIVDVARAWRTRVDLVADPVGKR
jgi:hypothetical protein